MDSYGRRVKMNKCTIFNNTFFGDLLPYEIIDDARIGLQIKYLGSGSQAGGSYNISLSSSEIFGFIENPPNTGYWQPAFISDGNLPNKAILGKTINLPSGLGIESAVSFKPVFKHWDMDSVSDRDNNAMCCNWFISSMAGGSLSPQYGVLFWYKQTWEDESVNNISLSKLPDNLLAVSVNDVYLSPDDDKSGVILSAGSVVTKISDTTVIDHSKSKYSFGINGGYRHNEGDIFVTVSPDTKFSLYYGDEGRRFRSRSNLELFMPDGEVFSYYHNKGEKTKHNTSGIASHTYLSPGLFPFYREIYHSITRRYSKNHRFTRKESMALQKLCYFLASGPMIDRTTIDILSIAEAHTIIKDYIALPVSDISSEKASLRQTIVNIMTLYKDMVMSPYRQSINSNYIYSDRQLVSKLLSKYGAVLNIRPNKSIQLTYKDTISTQVITSLGYFNYAPATSDSNTTLYNNMSIKIGNIEYASNLSSTSSTFKINQYNDDNIISSGEVPIPDASLPNISYTDLYAGGVIPFTWSPGTSMDGGLEETVIGDSAWRNINGLNLAGGLESSSFWEKHGGSSCLKFSNTAKDTFGKRRFDTSTNDIPMIFIKSSGSYDLKVTRTLYGTCSQSDIVTVSNIGSEFQSTTIVSENNILPRVICNGLKTIGFNDNGLIWLVDTDHYRDEGGNSTNSDDYSIYGVVRLKDIKIGGAKDGPLGPLNNIPTGVFSINFKGGNAGTWLISTDIEYLRNINDNTKNCKSSYREKIARIESGSKSKLILGSSDFYRVNPASRKFSARNCGNPDIPDITVGEPLVSTAYGPKVYPYGTYTDNIVDKIGIKIPFHPDPRKIDDTCIVPLPTLFSKNNFALFPSQTMYCFPENVEYGTSSMIVASGGHFHPGLGWTFDRGLIGKSSVISDKPDKQQCLTFKGGGLYNMRQGGKYTSNIYLTSLNDVDDSIRNHYGVGGVSSIDYSNYSSRSLKETTEDPWFNDTETDALNSNNICGGQIVQYGLPASVQQRPIKSIEVKLNYLNYFNPKNLKISIDISNNTFSKNIVLLNQEHIENYKNNFVITFSDYADKYVVPSKPYNTSNILAYHQKTLHNYDKLLASTVDSNSSDLTAESGSYSSRVEGNNDIYKLSKLDNITLTNTKFTLNVELINHLIDDGKVLDNLTHNDQMSGNNITENMPTSNTSLNSLCSWEIIAHMTDIKNPVSYNYVNGVDYSLLNSEGYSPYSSSYDYMVNLSDYKFLVPLVNINAPYPSLAKVNSCSYIDEDIARNVYVPRIEFPSLLPYAMAGLGFAFGSIVGGMVALATLNSFLGNGGRNDPIINYFIETRLLNQTETTNGQYYKPVYNKKYFGQADRAIVCLSKEGAFWYATEVPIFKYSNTPTFERKGYRYITPSGALYDLPYTKVKKIEELNLVNAPGSSRPINDNIVNDKTVLINGVRPKYLFQITERVGMLNTSNKQIEEAVILDINVISTSGGRKTLLRLDKIAAEEGYVRKISKDTILIYPTGYTGVVDNTLSFPNWSTEKTSKELMTDYWPVKHMSAYSPGSIGWGTTEVNPEVLHMIEPKSGNISISKLLDNKNNDLISNNNLTLRDNNAGTVNVRPTFGWSTTTEDYEYLFHKGIPINTDFHSFPDRATPLFLEVKITNTNLSDGILYIENDFIRKENNISLDDGRYWFTVYPDQPCILADELTVKVPTNVDITNTPITDSVLFGTSEITPRNVSITGESADRHLSLRGVEYNWSTPTGIIASEKKRLSELYGFVWSEPDEKFFYGSSDPQSGDNKKLLIPFRDDPKDAFLSIRETYVRPAGTRNLDNKKLGEVLDLEKDLKFTFRHIPRQLKNIDSEDFEKYIYDTKGNLSLGTGPASRGRTVGEIANNFVCWKCVDKEGKFVEPRAFMKNMNEMYYRGFFGSADRIEHKGDFLDTQDAWEWIPYEYGQPTCSQEIEYSSSVSPAGDQQAIVLISGDNVYAPSEMGSIMPGDTRTFPISTGWINSYVRWARARVLEDNILASYRRRKLSEDPPGWAYTLPSLQKAFANESIVNGYFLSTAEEISVVDNPGFKDMILRTITKTTGTYDPINVPLTGDGEDTVLLDGWKVTKVVPICIHELDLHRRQFRCGNTDAGPIILYVREHNADYTWNMDENMFHLAFNDEYTSLLTNCITRSIKRYVDETGEYTISNNICYGKTLSCETPARSDILFLNPGEGGSVDYSYETNCPPVPPPPVPPSRERRGDGITIKVIGNEVTCGTPNPCGPYDLVSDAVTNEQNGGFPKCDFTGTVGFGMPNNLKNARVFLYGDQNVTKFKGRIYRPDC
jgi:hypothetical protein